MPTGKLKWFDHKRGEGRIDAEREYPVRDEDKAADARVAGAGSTSISTVATESSRP